MQNQKERPIEAMEYENEDNNDENEKVIIIRKDDS